MSESIIKDLPITELITLAMAQREKAYAPYSGYLVGAAVLTEQERIYSGANVENASYGATVCAERSAIFRAVSEGARKLKAIAIVGGASQQEISSYAYPCGVCRQVMREFCENPDQFIVIVAKNVGDYRLYTLNELFPLGFVPETMA